MTDKTMRRFGRAPTLAATPLAAALLALPCAMPAEAWLEKGARMSMKYKELKSHVGNWEAIVKFNVGNLDEAFRSDGGSPDWGAVEGRNAVQLIKDVGGWPLKLVLDTAEAVRKAPKRVKEKFESFVGRTRDVRAAIAFDKKDQEYVSRADLLDKEPLPKVRVAAARSPAPRGTTGNGAAGSSAVEYVWNEQGTGVVALPSDGRDRRDPWAAAPVAGAGSGNVWAPTGAAADWGGWDRSDERYDDADRAAARVGVYARRCWGVEAVVRGNPLYHIMKRRMNQGECPNETADGTAGAAAGGDGARDGYAAALADALGDDPAGDGGTRDTYAAALADTLGDDPAVAAGDDYQGALGALEAREAERRRLAEQRRREEAERRQAEAARAERLKREREAREREERRLAELEERRIREQTARNNAAAWNAVIGSLTGMSASLAGMATGSGLSTGYMQMPQIQQQMPAYATAGSGSCDGQVNRQVQAALQRIMQRGQSSNAARTKYCAMANNAWAVIWGAEQCLNDPEYSSRRNEIRAQISHTRRNAQAANRAATQMGSKGCDCWTNICSR